MEHNMKADTVQKLNFQLFIGPQTCFKIINVCITMLHFTSMTNNIYTEKQKVSICVKLHY